MTSRSVRLERGTLVRLQDSINQMPRGDLGQVVRPGFLFRGHGIAIPTSDSVLGERERSRVIYIALHWDDVGRRSSKAGSLYWRRDQQMLRSYADDASVTSQLSDL